MKNWFDGFTNLVIVAGWIAIFGIVISIFLEIDTKIIKLIDRKKNKHDSKH